MGRVKIELQNISKSYYSDVSVTQALRKINLVMEQGEFIAITGESGGGKSTLLHIIGGLDSFDEGEMYLNGEPTFPYDEENWEDYRREKIGYVFQDYSLIGHYTALDNIVSALLILGKCKEEAEEKAYHYLNQVGLSGYEEHPATELSSGQKQRLSIARALAKETPVIIADEPTGNLDSETGEQIVKLLKEVSKDRLVVMVTHNYAQAEPYVTRKIRLHEGAVVSDVTLQSMQERNASIEGEEQPREEEVEKKDQTITTEVSETVKQKAEKGKERRKVAFFHARKNWCTQKGRGVLFTSFLFLISVVSFLLFGEIYLHRDDITTKTYTTKAFYKEDDTRIVVRHEDGSAITEEDREQLLGISYVELVDTCDFSNDINYYIEEGRDYAEIYGKAQRGSSGGKVISFLNENHFMLSADCLSEEELLTGSIPTARNEIVLYGNESLLGEELTCYFTANNIWDQNEYYKTTLKVVGILKEETEQVYFSREFCQMLSADVDSDVYRLCYEYDYSKEDYEQKPELIPVIAEDLTGDEVRISEKLENKTVGTTLFRVLSKESDSLENVVEQEVVVLEENHASTQDFIEVSEELFYRYYQKESTQASIYICSYAKTDQVLRELEKMGYQAISTYRVGMEEYQQDLVEERLTIIGIAVLGLLVLLIAEVLILRAFLKIRIKDAFVLKFMGMKMQMIRSVTSYEILGYSVVAMGITLLFMWGLRMVGICAITEILWYMPPFSYALFCVYNLALNLLSVEAFHHLLKGRLQA